MNADLAYSNLLIDVRENILILVMENCALRKYMLIQGYSLLLGLYLLAADVHFRQPNFISYRLHVAMK
jgi:hypothetical protein